MIDGDITPREYLAAWGSLIGETLLEVFLTPKSKGDAIWMSATVVSALWLPVNWLAHV